MINSVNPKEEYITPIEPIIELEFAYISSPAHAIKYPPDAATSSAKIITFFLFFFACDLIKSWIKCDWTGDPPGELIEMATAGAFLIEKAFLIISSCPAKSMPCLNFPTFPITPLSLI